jgi:hypothetical protein
MGRKMKDKFGNKKPVQIETNEWWFNGSIIMKQDDFRLPKWVSFPDTKDQTPTSVHRSKKEAIEFALANPVSAKQLQNYAHDYL